jgi:hypothetical protein
VIPVCLGLVVILSLLMLLGAGGWHVLLALLLCLTGIFATIPVSKVLRDERPSLADMALFAGALYFGLGTLVSVLSHVGFGTWPELFGPEDAVAASVLTIAGLGAIAVFARLILPAGKLVRVPLTGEQAIRALVLVAPVVWLGRLYVTASGILSQGGMVWTTPTALGATQSAVIGTVQAAGPGVIGLFAVCLASGSARRLSRKPLFWTFLLLEVGYQTIQGRRIFLGSLVVAAFVAIAWGWRPRRRHAVMAIVLLVLAVGVAWPFFLATRYSFRRSRDAGEEFRGVASVFTVLGDARNLIVGRPLSISQRHALDVYERAFETSYLATLWRVRRTSARAGPMMGELISAELVSLVPRVLWPDKFERLGDRLRHASLINRHHGLPEFDPADTWLTDAYADWGPAGIVAYALLIVVLCRLYEGGLGAFRGWLAVGFFLAYCQMAMGLFHLERHFGAVLGVLRTTAIFLAVFAAASVISPLPGGERSPSGRGGPGPHG